MRCENMIVQNVQSDLRNVLVISDLATRGILAERGICRRELAKKGLRVGLAEGAVPRSGIADLV